MAADPRDPRTGLASFADVALCSATRLRPCGLVARAAAVPIGNQDLAGPAGSGPGAGCLEIFMSGSADQCFDDAHDLPEISLPTLTVRTQRALGSAPVVLMRVVRMPAFAEAGASIVL